MMIESNDQTTERLARQVAHETGEFLTDAIRVSLEERLQRLTAKRNASMLASQVEEILTRVEAMSTLDSRSADEILGYDG
jgi:antitoxin VapB